MLELSHIDCSSMVDPKYLKGHPDLQKEYQAIKDRDAAYRSGHPKKRRTDDDSFKVFAVQTHWSLLFRTINCLWFTAIQKAVLAGIVMSGQAGSSQ